jgi:polyphosphate glucokinase
MELAHLPYRKNRTYEETVGLAALMRFGKKKWRLKVNAVIEELSTALEPDYVVLGGGNAKLLKDLPPKARLGDNTNAFKGGFRMWEEPKSAPTTPARPVRARRSKPAEES